MAAIPALRRLGQEEQKLKTSLSCIMRSCFKEKKILLIFVSKNSVYFHYKNYWCISIGEK
jgi:hypothetical protein